MIIRKNIVNYEIKVSKIINPTHRKKWFLNVRNISHYEIEIKIFSRHEIIYFSPKKCLFSHEYRNWLQNDEKLD